MFLFSSRNTQPNAQPSRAPTRPHPLSIKDWRFSSHVAPRPPGPESNDTFIEAAIDSLARIVLHPAAAANHSCPRPPPPSPARCTAPAFTGARRLSEARVLYVALFSFEVDLLVVLLHEIEGAVDRLVLVEAPFVHQRIRRKPMLWPTLSRQPRFIRFQSMVSYVQVPMQAPTSDIWHGERQATRAAGRAVVELANSLGFRPDDLIVSANTDEMLSQATLRSLQQCVLKGHTTAAGSWMPMGRLDHAFRPDWTVADRPYAFAPPTTYKWAEFERIQQRLRTSPSGPDGGRLFLPPDRSLYLLGAIHLTDSPSVPLSILKDLTATEYHARDAVAKIRRASTPYGADELQRSLVLHSRHSRRIVPVSRLSAFERQMLFVPWYLQCNPSRFPYMFDKPDPRNEFVAAKLAELLPQR